MSKERAPTKDASPPLSEPGSPEAAMQWYRERHAAMLNAMGEVD
jgi:hypothetical protein